MAKIVVGSTSLTQLILLYLGLGPTMLDKKKASILLAPAKLSFTPYLFQGPAAPYSSHLLLQVLSSHLLLEVAILEVFSTILIAVFIIVWTLAYLGHACLSCSFLESCCRLLLQKSWLCESCLLKKLRLFGNAAS
jgi:hypothetical protein